MCHATHEEASAQASKQARKQEDDEGTFRSPPTCPNLAVVLSRSFWYFAGAARPLKACSERVGLIPDLSLFLAARSHAQRLAKACVSSWSLHLSFSAAVLQESGPKLKQPRCRHVQTFFRPAGQGS